MNNTFYHGKLKKYPTVILEFWLWKLVGMLRSCDEPSRFEKVGFPKLTHTWSGDLMSNEHINCHEFTGVQG